MKSVITASVVATIAVLLGFADLPYGYTLIRLMLCGVCLFFIFGALLKLADWHRWILGGFAVLYNPIFPIQIGERDIWEVLNIATVVFLWFVIWPQTDDFLRDVFREAREKTATKIVERRVGDVTILYVIGRVTKGKSDELLKDTIDSLIFQGLPKVVLDLAQVPYIDSAGFGRIVSIEAILMDAGGSLRLLNVTERLRHLLTVRGWIAVFQTYDNEAAAVASFGGATRQT